jgi:hypothetical protein
MFFHLRNPMLFTYSFTQTISNMKTGHIYWANFRARLGPSSGTANTGSVHQPCPNCTVRPDPECTQNHLLKSTKPPLHKTTETLALKYREFWIIWAHPYQQKRPASLVLYFFLGGGGGQNGPRPHWLVRPERVCMVSQHRPDAEGLIYLKPIY